MGVRTLNIILDKQDKVYNPGERVTGRVRLVLDCEKKIKVVELKLKGKAKCKWDEEESYTDDEGHSQTRTRCRKSTETYLKNEQNLIGGKGKFKLAAGEHVYPFSVVLPIRAPTSFSSFYGEVSYYAKVKVDTQMAADKKERTEFTVINPLNLNLFPNLRTPYKKEKNKTFCCLCCASGPLTIVVYLPKTGFAASESIPITLEIDNASYDSVDAININLKREIKWTADGCHKHKDIKLEKMSLPGVEAGKSHNWSENFTIPPANTYPNLEDCSIIIMNHELHIQVVCGMFSNLVMHIPITIGDIPLSEDPNTSTVTSQSQPQTHPNNVSYNPNPDMQMPPLGVSVSPLPSPYLTRAHPAANYPYPGNQTGEACFGVPPLQICPQALPGYQPVITSSPNSSFVAINPYLNAGGVSPTLSVRGFPQPSSPALSVREFPQPSYLTGTYPGPGGAVPVHQYQPEIPRQPATNPEYAQNAPHPPVVYYAAAGDGMLLTPLLSSSPSAPRF
ncbi:arrestin domain-containing protein 3-like [Planococcus citri]|uniref:arrestin domain-containing protein 3-like n=1 Tax=Planococcus citri TaxID=170843 RepID=UPI0031F89841